jgi:hypothetical protein
MTMSFREQTSAFFDELTKILDAEKAEREADMDLRSGRPFSSELTQDEEPTSEYSPAQTEEAEPEVVTRGSA